MMAEMMQESEMCEKLRTLMDEERYVHSLGVRDCAVMLAQRYGADVEKARVAGLLHDCAKGLPREEMINRAVEAGIELGPKEFQTEALLHGPVGAVVARQTFGIDDTEILSAIECHTTGKSDMALLDKIIYLADYIEPNRDFPEVEELRRAAMEDLDKAVLMALRRTIKYVLDTDRFLHPRTVEAWNDMLKRFKEQKIEG
ncbi:bis(5'-nucleosyl)-tetraphosphatase (symmetrical) YqeK [Caldicoprobacter faecalis]|uniref:bis(5'-nucleosyl)-tetraphosphatase (symmetrical) n=1 Tax=Caldicoprobacter faecalis TaxID=937334 RepID=A0A1I5WQ84_9FIRM|nr:bis(5'-nucleosyl)-tetraphosphatase (symmetrical) YqeK [Caldicoprobacter faecalis]SFQ21678.1 putative HD superfamily hydrolase of NAD metabolism [Caldicoprobacter faecalis]